MTVHVTMLVSSLPEGFPHDERTIKYEDTGGSKYSYMLHNSGALLVFKRTGGDNDVEVTYGPSAWESVQGDAGSGR
ncbi:hypothetical protein [Streptomyces caniscabiei]|uniref:hypothetical protein n=1 Tax=Streptomyces caniscabiei TaxID=2746961 RepID=UPI00187290E7|nr:hypothetical protein [Streptomyces caniscabiei]MBE4761769.1 hypothetical protein [Streptomyces caniscabiei]